jgi:predicted kinase
MPHVIVLLARYIGGNSYILHMLDYQTFQRLSLLFEGVDDPGILKCVFMGGGPGSGKSYVAGELFGVDPRIKTSFSSYGLKLVNSDVAYETMLRKYGIDPKDLGKLYDMRNQNPKAWDDAWAIRTKAKGVSELQQKLYQQGRLGLIIDGTADDYNKIQRLTNEAGAFGYDCFMIFVNTTLETALERNRNRSRSISEEVVKESWLACQANLSKLQQLFHPGKFLIVDNNVGSSLAVMSKQIRAWMREPIQNHLGKDWIKLAGGRHSG